MISDDEDLEFLRLAALQSRKRKLEEQERNTAGPVSLSHANSYDGIANSHRPYRKRPKMNKIHRIRGSNRNNMMNSRVNSNLIAIPIAENKNEGEVNCSKIVDKVSVTKSTDSSENKTEVNSKFNRYDHSDNSDSESDIDVKSVQDDNDSPNRSDRGDSLDRLIDELENEIAGKPTKPISKEEKDTKDKKEVKSTDSKSSAKKNICKKPLVNSTLDVKLEESGDKKIADVVKRRLSTEVKSSNIELKEKSNLKKTPKTSESELVHDKDNICNNQTVNEKLSPRRERFSPRKDRYSPRHEQISPRNDRFSPRSEKHSPRKDRFSPRNERISPRSDRLSPRNDKNSPRSDRLSPRNRSISPLYRSFSPKRVIPLSPLRINTEVLNTITMAPLSPRSAAFVLQNREILAKRKFSPGRRSISSRSSSSSSYRSRSSSRKRSISPYLRSRFQYSPSRRYSPPPRRRSISPQRNEISIRRRTRSPIENRSYRRRSFSPKSGRSPSPTRRPFRKSPCTRSPISKHPTHRSPTQMFPTQKLSPMHRSNVRHRLGQRSGNNRRFPNKIDTDKNPVKKSTNPNLSNRSPSLSPNPKRNSNSNTRNNSPIQSNTANDKTEESLSEPKQALDPVLEARRRKFESNKPIEVTEGIIKLKVNKENQVQTEDKIEEEEEEIENQKELSETEDIVSADIADLWSSDESDNEKEGRFKNSASDIHHSHNKNVPSLSSRTVSLKSLENTQKNKRIRDKKVDTPSKGGSFRNKDVRIETHKRKIHTLNRISRKSFKDVIKKSAKKSIEIKSKKTEKPKINVTNNIPSEKVDREIQTSDNVRIVVSDIKNSNAGIKENRKITEVIVENENSFENKTKKDLDDFEPEIVYEDETPTETNAPDDLRTELSRRRAQRKTMSQVALQSGPPTRLYQTAFQEMSKKSLTSLPAFHKSNKILKKEREGKLPIHMRLGNAASESTRHLKSNIDDDGDDGDDDDETDSNSVPNKMKIQSFEGRKKRILGLQV